MAAGSSVAAAEASAAPAIAVAEPCVVNLVGSTGTTMVVGGSGFTPGDTVAVQAPNDAAFGYSTVDAAGNLLITMPAPVLAGDGPAVSSFTLTATDQTNPLASPPMTSFFVANLAVATKPAQAKPAKRVTWTFSGFSSGKTIYGHYLHGKKVAATRAFGRASGPCGVLKTRKVFYPGKPKYGLYKVQIDDSRRYSPKSLPHWIGSLNTHIIL